MGPSWLCPTERALPRPAAVAPLPQRGAMLQQDGLRWYQTAPHPPPPWAPTVSVLTLFRCRARSESPPSPWVCLLLASQQGQLCPGEGGATEPERLELARGWGWGGRGKAARVPGSLHLFLRLVSGASKHVPALHKWSLGFLQPRHQSHWFANQPRCRTPGLGCPACGLNSPSQGGSLRPCNPLLFCGGPRSQSDGTLSFPTRVRVDLWHRHGCTGVSLPVSSFQ